MDESFEKLKAQLRMYRSDLITFDHVFGYLQALCDADVIASSDVPYIIECMLSDDDREVEWIYE